MSSPLLWGGNNTSNNLQNQILLSNRKLISNDGVKNYINNATLESGVSTGWSAFTTTLTSGLPTGTITLTSASLVVSPNTSVPLTGTTSLGMSSAGVASAGQGFVSDAFTIDREDLANVLAVRFSYLAVSGSANINWSGILGSQSIGVYLYDVTNAVWVQPAGFLGMNQGTGAGQLQAVFQTNATTASQYRLAVLYLQSSAGATNVVFDSFFVGPQVAPQGAIITDPVAYTPTFTGFGTPSAVDFMWSRDGANMILEARWTSGTTTAVTAAISLPPGLTIANTFPSTRVVGRASCNAGGAQDFTVLAAPGTNTITFGSATSSPLSAATGTAFLASTPAALFAIIPISGWTSNVEMSSSSTTSVVAAIITGDPASATSGNPIIVPTVVYDSLGAYDSNTGRYTVPITGVYKMYGALTSASTATTLSIYVNAVSTILAGSLDSNGEATFAASVRCNAGDIIDIGPGGTVDATSMSLNIERLSGPAVLAIDASVNARYFASSTTISGTLATIVWTTADFDSHTAMASGVYTIPVSGKYQVNCNLAVSGTFILNNTSIMQLQVNGASVSDNTRYIAAAITNESIQISDIIECNAGDTVRIQYSTQGTGPAIVSSNTRNFFSIARVGN